MTITITATSAGFHYLSPIGETIAPEVFFEGAFNRLGEIYQAGTGQTWRTKESYVTPNQQVEARLARDAALPPGARAGDQTILALEGFDFMRVANGVTQKIGDISFSSVISVSATFAPNGSAAIGQGAKPNWVAAVGTPIQSEAADAGYAFIGSDARDVFDPSFDFIPISAPGVIEGFGGNDVLVGQNGGSEIRGGSGNDEISARGGSNAAWGGAGADQLIFSGLISDQRGYGGTGADLLRGGRGDDALYGGRGKDRLAGSDGDDHIQGGRGRDIANGQEGDDRLGGGTGHDVLRGGFGDDTLIGGKGNDRMIGGAGADTFVFATNSGDDIIRDFEPGIDRLQFASGISPENVLIEGRSLGALVTFGEAGASVLLVGVDAEGLTPGDLFV